jgi:hypothetical protein
MMRTKAPKKGKRQQGTKSPGGDVTGPSIVDRPDGYYWSGPDGDAAFGPYETYELAQAARDAIDDEAVAPGDTLMEVEREIGIADWIDAETGEPAEGQSPPHLQED